MTEFKFYQPTTIEFGPGKLEKVGEIVARYGDRCLLVTTSNEEVVLQPLYNKVKRILEKEDIYYVHFDEVVPNPSIHSVETAIKILRNEKLQVIIAVGGGSSMDTAKAISIFNDADAIKWDEVFQTYTDAFKRYESIGNKIPMIAVPTTAGTGSELTQAMVLSDPDKLEKNCIFHQDAFPDVALVDPELTRTLPKYLTAITGFDAFTHSFESYMRECASNYTRMLGIKSMEIIIDTLPILVNDTSNMELRCAMSEAASYSGISLSNAAASIPHPLSEIIGGIEPKIPHGQCLASLYPAYIEYICTREVEKCADIARIFKKELTSVTDEKAARELPMLMVDFLKNIGIYKKLCELGVTEEQFSKMKNHFLLNVLPFAPKADLVEIFNKSY